METIDRPASARGQPATGRSNRLDKNAADFFSLPRLFSRFVHEFHSVLFVVCAISSLIRTAASESDA